jgi:hypothetical protein
MSDEQKKQDQQQQAEVKQADGAQGADAGAAQQADQQPGAAGSGDVDTAQKNVAPAKDDDKAAAKKSGSSKKQPGAPAAGGHGDQPKPAGKLVAVKSLVNMICPDGTQMVKGKVVELSQDEFARQKQDARGAVPRSREVKGEAPPWRSRASTSPKTSSSPSWAS